ncbi:hypothetical protein CBS101457_000623 [Exobasidium rhododendri]|nr:hypothetical protein CBS101457_000623 [Exobasidium rhododendri]
MPRLAPILRGSLHSTPGPSGAIGSYALPCRKLVLEYNEMWPSSRGTKIFVEKHAYQLAQRWPSVEVVTVEKPNQHPIARGFYPDHRQKAISLRNLQSNDVANKVMLLLETSGKKITSLKRKPVVAGAPESARGMWSAMHGARK